MVLLEYTISPNDRSSDPICIAHIQRDFKY